MIRGAALCPARADAVEPFVRWPGMSPNIAFPTAAAHAALAAANYTYTEIVTMLRFCRSRIHKHRAIFGAGSLPPREHELLAHLRAFPGARDKRQFTTAQTLAWAERLGTLLEEAACRPQPSLPPGRDNVARKTFSLQAAFADAHVATHVLDGLLVGNGFNVVTGHSPREAAVTNHSPC